MLKVVSYDLHYGSPAVYQALIQEIQRVAVDSIEIQKSVWVVESDHTCSDLRDILIEQLREGDKLFVAPLPAGSSWVGIPNLKEFLRRYRE